MNVRRATRDDIPAISRIHVDTWRTTYAGIMPAQYLAKLSYEERERRWATIFDESAADESKFVLVAEDNGDIVGFANGGPARESELADSEIYAIYVSDLHQRRGFGRALIHRLATNLKDAGFTSVIVRVLAHNPACKFYEALGGKHVSSEEIVFGGVALEEVIYHWSSLSTLLQNAK
jgi:ribosomal protein S18 acetylase RimI-like enzyme